MAPPPEYDKEPKAPDKSATNISSEESKTLHNIVNDQQTNSDSKPANTTVAAEVENNKHVEHLDDGQLKALLDEAITYKCPKDREGKSSLFNELLEEVEQDEQALEAAARELSGGRAARRARAGRRALPHSNSLQNLEQEALAAESALRRVRHAPHHHANVSARAIHGGSLPSDVDKSFLLGEEPAARGAGYLATVRCVNPPPLAERRVSASDANCPAEMELLNRRSKPPFPMTYTARATLEIGSGSVCSGRAVTTTTSSNQVRTPKPLRLRTHPRRLSQHKEQHPNLRFVVPDVTFFRTPPTSGPPERLCAKTKRLYIPIDRNIISKPKQFHNPKDGINKPKLFVNKRMDTASKGKQKRKNIKMKDTLGPKAEEHQIMQSNELTVVNEDIIDPMQLKLLSALVPKQSCNVNSKNGGGNQKCDVKKSDISLVDNCKDSQRGPRGPEEIDNNSTMKLHRSQKIPANLVVHTDKSEPSHYDTSSSSLSWLNQVNSWYEGLGSYSNSCKSPENAFYQALHPANNDSRVNYYCQATNIQNRRHFEERSKNTNLNIYQNIASGDSVCSILDHNETAKNVHYVKPNSKQAMTYQEDQIRTRYSRKFDDVPRLQDTRNVSWLNDNVSQGNTHTDAYSDELSFSRQEYRNRVGRNLHAPSLSSINPRNIRSMSIGKPAVNVNDITNVECAYTLINEHTADKTNQDTKCVYKIEDIVATDKSISKESVNLRSHINNEFFSCNELECNDNIVRIEHCETDKLNHSVRSSTPIPVEENSSTETEFNETELAIILSSNNDIVNILGQTQDVFVEVFVDNEKETELDLDSTDSSQEVNDKDIELEHRFFPSQDEPSSFVLEEGVELNDINSDIRRESNSFSQYLAEQKKLFQALETIKEENSVQDNFCDITLDNSVEKVCKDSEIMEKVQCSANNLGYKNKLLNALDTNFVEDSYIEDNFSIISLDISSEKVQIDNKLTKQVNCCNKNIQEECVKTANIEVQSVFTNNRNLISATSECSNKLVIDNKTAGGKTEFVTSDENLTDSALQGTELVVVHNKIINGKGSVDSGEKSTHAVLKRVNKTTGKHIKSVACDATVESVKGITFDNDPVGATSEALNKIVDNKMEPLVCDENSVGATANDCKELVIRNNAVEEIATGAQSDLPELPDNAFVSLTFLKNRLPAPSVDETIRNGNATKPKKSIEKVTDCSGIKKYMVDKDALRTLLLQNLFKSDDGEQSVKLGAPAITENQVDSAIPFNCITTSEIVDSCNTTPSTAQSTVAEEAKPLQLGSCYRAVASLTGHAPPAPRPALAPAPLLPLVRAATARLEQQQPRLLSSSFNGLPLARASYGSTASSAPDEFKKSLDENGNSVQGYSSPLSGSSQHKKPRRKKSSKNETVITSEHIDGYQGNKEINELLRFIESNADHGRGQKLGRAKHKDDSEDKCGKKRSTERRKDKEPKMKRATSMEELSRTKLEDLTDKPSQPERWAEGGAGGKAERRSWGDDSRGAYYYRDEPTAPDAPPDADFQTVTKKRKPRRRADDTERDPAAGDPPPPPPAPAPRARRVSAPPSDRSNDSNDDMDSVHSLPADAPPHPRGAPPAAPVSYADIARTRHNIPDLIESCNFYAEGEGGLPGGLGGLVGLGGGGEAARRALEPAPPAPGDADGYPALEPRAPAARRARDRDRDIKPAVPPATVRRDRKERPVEAPAPAAECPAPDVVADRRPPVILLDSAARPRDMDGITFGFDINEQLLGGPTRRPRCDLVRDAVEGAEESAATVIEGATVLEEGGVGDAEDVGVELGVGVAVRAGCAALRYVAPAPPPDTHHLLQIVDYVGAAWEDVVRCGSGKVRYFSE